MCLIIHSPAKHEVPKEILQSAFKKNDDGWGLMRLSNHGVYVEKGLGDFEKFYELYQKRFKSFECAIHFRSATQGVINIDQAHPYKITEDAWLMHNGYIWSLPQVNVKTKSDSWNFARTIQEMVEKGWLASDNFISLMEAAIDQSNRVVLLSKDYGFQFLNKESGREYKGAWYSNTYAWELPSDLARQIAEEKAEAERKAKELKDKQEEEERKKREAFRPQPVTYNSDFKLTTEDEASVIDFFACAIANGDVDSSILLKEDEAFIRKVMARVEDIKKTQEGGQEEVQEAIITAEAGPGSLLRNTRGVPLLPTLTELADCDLADFKELSLHYPESLAEMFFDLVQGR